MVKSTITLNIEDLRRTLGLAPNFTIKSVSILNNSVSIESESEVPPDAIKRISGEDRSVVLKIIAKAIERNKEIAFSYYNDRRDAIEITTRKFLPLIWINNDCIEGFDLDKKETRRFCPSRMNWIENIL